MHVDVSQFSVGTENVGQTRNTLVCLRSVPMCTCVYACVPIHMIMKHANATTRAQHRVVNDENEEEAEIKIYLNTNQ